MDLHVFFLPFLTPGHMIPMVDLARLFASHGVKVTVVTTPGNVHLVRPTIDVANSDQSPLIHRIQLLSIPFPAAECGLPEGYENLLSFSNPEVTPEFAAALERLESPFVQLLRSQRPDYVVSDIFYPWTTRAAQELGIPRLVFHGTNFFSLEIMRAIAVSKLWEREEPLIVPGFPHRIEMTRSQLPQWFFRRSNIVNGMANSMKESSGMIVNSFYEIEADYINMHNKKLENGNRKTWHVGPVSMLSREISDRAARGNMASITSDECLKWLEAKKPRSVLYMCFGSLARFTETQMREIASGLAASGHPFVWVLRHSGEASKWLPEGFEEVTAGGRGLVINGWAPQLLVLNHEAVGGFVTHCGWNSCLEGVCAGVPMATWPLFAEQFFNERLLVDVLGVGVGVGVNVWSNHEEERDLVKGEELARAVKELMGSGEEAEERRRKARALAEAARRAVQEGGSSHANMTDMLQELVRKKAALRFG